MKSCGLSSILGASLAILMVGRVSAPPPETKPLDAPSQTKPSHSLCAALESAAKLLREHGLNWGEPRQVLRTVSNWYRLEYVGDSQGRERVVLVNPANNEAEFPLPR